MLQHLICKNWDPGEDVFSHISLSGQIMEVDFLVDYSWIVIVAFL